MNKTAQRALEKEWKTNQANLLNERIALEEAVKADLIAALREKQQQLKREAVESRKGKPLGERIAEITGVNMPDNWYEQTYAKRAIKDLTANDKNGTFAVADQTLTAQHKYNRQKDALGISHGQGVDGTKMESWVEAQAKARLTEKGLAPAAPKETLPITQ